MISGSMKQEHWKDSDGRPAGGSTFGNGFAISWQNGPLGKIGTPERKEPNGAFVEDIIQAAIGRLEFYQQSEFACIENEIAIEHLKTAAESLASRTASRVQARTEGTHEK